MIGILGGTFDPIHFGHLRTALEVMQRVGLSEVRFIPLHRAVHKDQPETDGQLRLQMVRAAIAGQAGFVADDLELRRRGDSYTLDTLTALGERFPGRRLCLLMGMDAFNGFTDWRHPLEILRLAHLIVMHRPAQAAPADARAEELYEARRCDGGEALVEAPAGRILRCPVTQLDISSSAIRALIAAGESVRYLLPESVLQIIGSHGLYLDPQEGSRR